MFMKRLMILIAVVAVALASFYLMDDYGNSSLVDGNGSNRGILLWFAVFLGSFMGKKKYRAMVQNAINKVFN